MSRAVIITVLVLFAGCGSQDPTWILWAMAGAKQTKVGEFYSLGECNIARLAKEREQHLQPPRFFCLAIGVSP